MTDKVAELENRLASLEAKFNDWSRKFDAPQDQTARIQRQNAAKVPAAQEKLASLWDSPGSQTRAPSASSTPTNQTRSTIGVHAMVDQSHDTNAVSKVLGIGGGFCMLLATAYLINLAIASGWFTPVRQIAASIAVGTTLLIAGIFTMDKNRSYSAILSGTALPVFFLAIAGARLRYNLIGDGTSFVMLGLTSALAVFLDRLYQNTAFGFLAVIGAYLGPLVSPSLVETPIDTITYFSATAIAFAAYAYIQNSRTIYLCAMYLGLVAFYGHFNEGANWRLNVLFQSIQLVLYSTVAALLSIKAKRPMGDGEAWAHVPALAIFYLVCFLTLQEHAPAFLPFFVVGSAIILNLVLLIASGKVKVSPTIKGIVYGYTAIALIHGVYFNAIPSAYRPWVGLVSGPAVMFLLKRVSESKHLLGPLLTIVTILFIGNNIHVLFAESPAVWQPEILRLLYGIQLWLGFWFLRDAVALRPLKELCLYGGHIQALGTVVAFASTRLQVSIAWSCLAVAILIIGIQVKSKEVGRSALLIIGAASAKAAFYDLESPEPLVRILCFAILGVCLFGSGWLYNRLPDQKAS